MYLYIDRHCFICINAGRKKMKLVAQRVRPPIPGKPDKQKVKS